MTIQASDVGFFSGCDNWVKINYRVDPPGDPATNSAGSDRAAAGL